MRRPCPRSKRCTKTCRRSSRWRRMNQSCSSGKDGCTRCSMARSSLRWHRERMTAPRLCWPSTPILRARSTSRPSVRCWRLDAKTLSAFEALHEDLSALKSLAPDEPVLQQWQRRLHTVLDGEIQSQVAQGAYDGAQALLAQYADIASAEYVETQRALLEKGR